MELVDTNLTKDAWEDTLQESRRAATRRASAKTEQEKDTFKRMKKREKYT